MQFFADEMLGKLARWLRMSGLDVRYERSVQDATLVKFSRAESRIILTRDTRLIRELKKEDYLFISHNDLEDQILEFYHAFPRLLSEQNPLTRCVECNTRLQPVDREQIKDRVWPYVYRNQRDFTECPSCRKVYWEATHVEKIRQRLHRMLKAAEGPY